MKLFYLTLLICALASWVNGQLPDWITNCGDDKDILTIDSINLTPNALVAGQNIHIDFKGKLSKTVDKGASVNITVKLGTLTLINKKYDFCEEVTQFGGACPLNEGPIQFSKDVVVPKEIPAGKYTVDAKASTADNEQITCLHAVATLSGPK